MERITYNRDQIIESIRNRIAQLKKEIEFGQVQSVKVENQKLLEVNMLILKGILND